MKFTRFGDIDWEDTAVSEVRDEHLRALVDDLPEPDRTVISMKYFGAGATVQEIADVLGYTTMGVYVAHDRAISKLENAVPQGD